MIATSYYINPIQDGWGQKKNPTSFSPVTSANVGISSQNFLKFSFSPCKIPSLYLVPVPNHCTSTKTTPQKKWFFWSNRYKIEVVITSLIEMLELPNFGHMNNLQYNLNHMMKFSWWRYRQELWCHNLCFKIPLF